MQIVTIDTDIPVLLTTLATEGADLEKLVQTLIGEGEFAYLLKPVVVGSVPHDMGADVTLLIAISDEDLPKGGFGVGGVYAVSNWVYDHVDPAMPAGWGAAMTQPMISPGWIVETDEMVWVAVISPMNREKTSIRAVYINDPHDEGPTLIM